MIRAWLAKLFKKKQPELLPETEPEPEYEDDYMGYTVIDEATGMLLSVLMVCGCGNAVVRMGTEQDRFFYCEHCDRTCANDRPCSDCYAHFLFDAESVRSEFLGGFDYNEDEE